jgi:hypothetical protein
VLAPKVPPVVIGTTIPVTYDLRGYAPDKLHAPALNVSFPGEDALQLGGIGLYPYYSVALTAPNGTVDVPVSALAGAGTYTIWIDLQPGTPGFASDVSDLAFTRVDAGTARPPAPLLSLPHDTTAPAHTLEVPYKSPFVVAYDVSHVPGASGAIVELAAPPPSPVFYGQGLRGGMNTFRNPNGNALDDDGVITGSIYHVRSAATAGSVTIDPVAANIPATTTVNVRVLAANGSGPIAEASDAGTIQYDGVSGTVGLPIAIVYANPNGDDGVLTEVGVIGSRQANTGASLIEPFGAQSGAVTGPPLVLATGYNGVFPIVQGDVGMAMSSLDLATFDYYRASPLAAGFGRFAFPAGSLSSSEYIFEAASNSSSTRSAYLGQDLVSNDYFAIRGDVATGSGFSTAVDVSPTLGPNFDPLGVTTFAYDPSTDRGYFVAEDQTIPCENQSPQLVTIDFTAGTVATRPLNIGAGDTNSFYQMAIDPTTHVAAIATSCQVSSLVTNRTELSLVDLATGTTTRVFQHRINFENFYHAGTMIGGDSPVVGIDPVNHLVLQRSILCPAVLGNFDLNARPCLNEYDESGRLVKTVPGLFSDSDLLQYFSGVNGTTRTGASTGQEFVSNGFFIESSTVQPYSY